jgi:hypothetical protein
MSEGMKSNMDKEGEGECVVAFVAVPNFPFTLTKFLRKVSVGAPASHKSTTSFSHESFVLLYNSLVNTIMTNDNCVVSYS